ncbi:MAG: hypothetical protein R2747_21610 [Pyrinomonadaceae bacterium]
MSEPEVPVKREIQANQADEKVASLYDPLETGDLEGWDISPEDSAPPAGPPEPTPEPPEPPDLTQAPTDFQVPQHSFEILKPAAAPKSSGDDWGMAGTAPPIQDGWKMPEPVFRVSEGRSFKTAKKIPEQSVAPDFQEQPSVGNLPGIYAPPDTEDIVEPITEDFSASAPDTEEYEVFDFNAATAPPQAAPPEQMEEKAAAPAKGKGGARKLILILLGIITIGVIAGLIIVAVFGMYFYSSSR